MSHFGHSLRNSWHLQLLVRQSQFAISSSQLFHINHIRPLTLENLRWKFSWNRVGSLIKLFTFRIVSRFFSFRRLAWKSLIFRDFHTFWRFWSPFLDFRVFIIIKRHICFCQLCTEIDQSERRSQLRLTNHNTFKEKDRFSLVGDLVNKSAPFGIPEIFEKYR